jgi:hypothetical protein
VSTKTQPPTEMGIRNVPGGKGWQVHEASSKSVKILTLKNTIFWDLMPWSPVEVHHCFRGTCRLCCAYCLLLASFILDLLFDPETGGSTLLQSIGEHLPDCLSLHPRRYYTIHSLMWKLQIHWGSHCMDKKELDSSTSYIAKLPILRWHMNNSDYSV